MTSLLHRSPHRPASSARVRAGRVLAAFSAMLVVASTIALAQQPAAAATGDVERTDSAITVRWADPAHPEVGPGAKATADEVARVQPIDARAQHAPGGAMEGSGHWEDFEDLEVTVSQTAGLIDQAVIVTATGLAPTIVDNGPRGNYLQVFQCHGDDPNAPDFRETCQYGAFSSVEMGTGSAAYEASVVAREFNPVLRENSRFRFRSVQGDRNEPVEVCSTGCITNTGLGRFFNASSTNEAPFVPVRADAAAPRGGRAEHSFVVQSAAAQPYLGCGDPASAGERCWLVVVPRGIHSGSFPGATGTDTCNGINGNDLYGEERFRQLGSPISGHCTLWDNRVVVPLDFDNPYLSCPAGSAERRVVGTEAVAEAVSSWQPRLCAGDDGATFSLTTNSGDLVRQQLLTSQADLAAVSQPLAPDTIGPADPALLEGAELRYAPLANTALTIAFVAEGPTSAGSEAYRDIRLTPRLLAKMMTQSYQFDVPMLGLNGEETVGDSLGALKLATVANDPEWNALNPAMRANIARSAWLAVGPNGDDAIRALWEYVLADADAVAFLRGEPDPWGTTINPYYLPPDHPNAAGGGFDLLSAPIDTLPKADQSLAPDKERADRDHRGQQIDSQRLSPYSPSFAANAERILTVDKQTTRSWNPTIQKPPLPMGDWEADVPAPPVSVGGRFALGPTTASAAELYHVDVAQLALPLAEETSEETVASAREFVPYSDETVATAIAAQKVDAASGVATPEAGSLPSGAYPLASTVYAAVNLASTSLDTAATTEYAGLLDYAAGDGNVRTGKRGGLPEGYVPLTEAQAAQTGALADELRAWTPPAEPGGDEQPPAGGEGDGAPAAGSTATGGGGAAAASTPDAAADPNAAAPTTSALEAGEPEATAATGVPAQGALGGSLIAGALGLAASPFLLRRRNAP